ncbi:hypothetical protein KSS87_006247 [Heliosperma pusillum]|nr:hypothetical protein KSS87_006247 [Heliosperma pusillum]
MAFQRKFEAVPPCKGTPLKTHFHSLFSNLIDLHTYKFHILMRVKSNIFNLPFFHLNLPQILSSCSFLSNTSLSKHVKVKSEQELLRTK